MKNKNNILIIITVTMSALAVIAVVLVTGFATSGKGGESVISVHSAASEDSSEVSSEAEDSAAESSEPAPESSESAPESSDISEDGVGQRVAESASALIGVPFAENGASPSGFDNSGFIYYVLRENGYITCPRTTDAQSRMGARVSRDDLKPGDLVFFGSDDGSRASFGGIYSGNGTMIACLSPGTSVRMVDITTDYYKGRFYGGISLS